MAFHEVQFPTDVSRNARGGPRRKVQIVTLSSGDEERNASWLNSRRAYDVAYGVRSADALAAVTRFFEARGGQLYGFRFKDWSDYKSCDPSGQISSIDQPLGTGDGVTTAFQLVKEYTSGAVTYSRKITKPIEALVSYTGVVAAGPELVLHWDNPQSRGAGDWSNFSATGQASGVSGAGFTQGYEIGLSGAGRTEQNTPLAVTPGQVYRVTGWLHTGSGTNASLSVRDPAIGTSVIRGPMAAPVIYQEGAGAITNIVSTDLGGGTWKWEFDWVPLGSITNARAGAGNMVALQTIVVLAVSVRTPTSVAPAIGWTLDTTTGLVTFASPPVLGATMRAGFTFDVPVRFDTEAMDSVLDFERLGSINSIPLLEVRR